MKKGGRGGWAAKKKEEKKQNKKVIEGRNKGWEERDNGSESVSCVVCRHSAENGKDERRGKGRGGCV